jgi:capsular exopolysaccharide synthesis family protein
MLEKSYRPTQTARDLDPRTDDDEIDLLEMVSVLWRGKWIIAACAALALLVGGYYAYVLAVPKYRSTATLALELRNEQIVDIESVFSGVSGEQSAINTELEVIRSRGLLQRLAEDLELANDPEFNAALRPEPSFSLRKLIAGITTARGDGGQSGAVTAEEISASEEMERNSIVGVLRDAIGVSNLRQTYIFEISATTEDPRKSQRITNALAELYIQDQIDVKFSATENAVAWLSERVVELESDLREREDRIKDMRANIGLVSVEAMDALNQQLRDRRSRLADAEATVALQEARIAALAEMRASGSPAEIAAQFDDPTLVRLAQDIEAGSGNARQLFDNRADLLTDRIAANLDRQRQQAAALTAAFTELSTTVETQSQQLLELQRLERETEATRTLYDTFLNRLKETSVQRGLQLADSRVLSEATPGRLVEPQKSRILALSIVLGTMLGIAIVLVRQFLNNGYRTSEELERDSRMTILGQIPLMPISKRTELIDYLNDKPTSAAVEAVRNMRTSVLLSNIDQPPQVILSTSSVPGEGKTTISIALAHNLAGLGKRVLLLEADIRRRTFGEYFDIPLVRGGLIAAMTGQYPIEDCVVRDPRMNIDIMMGEKSSINAADLFSSERFQDLMNELRTRYDFIIIDTPPVLVVPDARVIGQVADAIIFAVAWDRTSRAQVTEALRQFATVNVRVTGLALSQISPKGMKRYGYGGRYGAYSSYGKAYYDA